MNFILVKKFITIEIFVVVLPGEYDSPISEPKSDVLPITPRENEERAISRLTRSVI